jgi:hypothetical protein
MIDFAFIEAVAASLSLALRHELAHGLPSEWNGSAATGEELQRLCRRAALRLFVDLDGRTMLDLALQKITSELDIRVPSSSDSVAGG